MSKIVFQDGLNNKSAIKSNKSLVKRAYLAPKGTKYIHCRFKPFRISPIGLSLSGPSLPPYTISALSYLVLCWHELRSCVLLLTVCNCIYLSPPGCSVPLPRCLRRWKRRKRAADHQACGRRSLPATAAETWAFLRYTQSHTSFLYYAATGSLVD